MHRQADDVWRIDLQLGPDADPDEEKEPENVRSRGSARCSARRTNSSSSGSRSITFACRRIDNFRHDRVSFAGDAAHQVSPFGARGANTGVQDVDNLGVEAAAVLDGEAAVR